MATSISRRAEGGSSLVVPRPTLRTVTIGGVALALLAAAAFFVSRSSLLHVRNIELSGASHLSAPEVIRESGVSEGTNAVWLDTAAAEAELERDPWISSATVERVLPWTIRILVVERTPVAAVVLGSGYELIAADGTGLGIVASDPGLPRIIASPSTTDEVSAPSPRGAALVVGGLDEDLRSMVKDVRVGAAGAIEVRLRGGIRVNIGEPVEIRRKVDVLAATLRWAREQHLRVRAIDVSAPDAPAVRFAS